MVEEELAQFRSQGYFMRIPSGAEYARLVASARAYCLDLIEGTGTDDFKQVYRTSDGVARHIQNVHSRPEIRDLIHSPEVSSVIQTVFGGRRVTITHSKISFKRAGANNVWKPHQDNAYKVHDGDLPRLGMTMAILLEEVDTSSC